MTGNVIWIVVAVLAACGVIAWLLLKRGKSADAPAAPAEAVVDAPVSAPAAPVPPVDALPVDAPPIAPAVVATPPVVHQPPPPPPPPPAPPRGAAPVVVSPSYVIPPVASRPPPVVIERVLALAPVTAADWDAAQPLTLLPAQTAAVAAAIAGVLRPGPAPLHGIVLEAGVATAIARGDQERMRALAAAHGESPGKGTKTWLDSPASVALVATALAALASDRFLSDLGDEVRELKGAVVALPPRLATQGGASFKTLMQDLSRFTREARDNYASAIGKLAFRERVAEAEERAIELWREAVARVDAVRQQIQVLASLPRFGEAQVEKALATYRDLQDQRSVQEIGGRVLAAARLLRISIGHAPAAGGGDPLASALAALQAGQEQDAELATRMATSEQAAKSDPYVGKAEFEANRAALRKSIAKAAAPSPVAAASAAMRIEATRDAMPLDAAGGSPHTLLIGPGPGDTAGLRWLEAH